MGQRIRPLIVAITGGIAAGKSLVASYFSALGVETIDADAVARDIVKPGTRALKEIVEHFGSGILTPDGALDRAAMRARIYASPTDRRTLEKLLHPKIGNEIRRRSLSLNRDYVLIEIPLLAESGDYQWVDRILVIDLPESLQIERVVKRDRTNEVVAKCVIAAQSTRSTRLKMADDVIINDAELEPVKRAVAHLHQLYTRLASLPAER
jgi:dephospho-CoA kinase